MKIEKFLAWLSETHAKMTKISHDSDFLNFTKTPYGQGRIQKFFLEGFKFFCSYTQVIVLFINSSDT